MVNHPNEGADAVKKPYVKPEIRQIALRPEEAILGACKASGVAGPAQASCTSPSSCSGLGS